jgi:hypothetical protein
LASNTKTGHRLRAFENWVLRKKDGHQQGQLGVRRMMEETA